MLLLALGAGCRAPGSGSDPAAEPAARGEEEPQAEAPEAAAPEPASESADADRDGMADAWEVLHGLDPSDPSDAQADGDGDGVPNLGEHDADSHPRIPDSDPNLRNFFVEKGSGCTQPYPICGGEAHPFDDIDACAALLEAGDTCWVKDGIYTRGIDSEDGRPYQPERSGTPDRPVAFRAYPGHRPLIRGGAGVSWSFGLGERRDFVRYSGFRVEGAVRVRGDGEGSRARGVAIEDFEICGGGGRDDGNWSGILAEFVEDLEIRDSVIRDVASPSGGSAKGITLFNGRRTLVEHNQLSRNPSEAVFDKEGGEDNVYRRNVFEDNGVALKLNNQSDSTGVENERSRIYENVFRCTEGPGLSIYLLSQPTDWDVFNNTGFECAAILVRSRSGPATGGLVYNNIWWSSVPGRTMWESQFGDDREPDFLDYNLYAPQGRFRENRYGSESVRFDSLAAWQQVPHPRFYDAHSLEGDPRFADPEGGDFRLAPDSPARGAGVAGEDLGAWPRRDATTIGPSGGPGPADGPGPCFPDAH